MQNLTFAIATMFLLFSCEREIDLPVSDIKASSDEYCSPAKNFKTMSEVREIGRRVIYGSDNRKDYFCLTENERSFADTSVALVFSDKIIELDSANFTIDTQSYKDAFGLCESERYSEQRVGAFCSGSFVRPNHVLTAAHCVDKAVNSNTQNPEVPLANLKFVFGFHVVDSTGALKTELDKNNLFGAKTLTSYEFKADGTDWAVIELDRPVSKLIADHIKVNDTVAVSLSTSQTVSVAGYPTGLALKYADDAIIEDVGAGRPVFLTNLDAYGGNSGSPVFDQSTGNVIGILTRGDTDFIYDGKCNRSNVNTQHGGKGERVVKISVMDLPDF